MHKRTHLTVTDSKLRIRLPKKRANHKRRNWNRTLLGIALFLFLAEAGALLFANPYFRVTRVRVDGAQTLTPQQVYAEAQVPDRTNIFWMLRQPFARRLAQDPVIDHAERSVALPNLLVLTVTERQPRVVLFGRGQFWLLDKKGIPYRLLPRPLPQVPLLQVSRAVMPETVTLGKPLPAVWLSDAYRLLALLPENPDLEGAKITVDQNMNLCLNRQDNLQIRLGQPDSLSQKLALADATVSAQGGALARDAAYIDVSCPQQPVYKPRGHEDEEGTGQNRNEDDRTQIPNRLTRCRNGTARIGGQRFSFCALCWEQCWVCR